VVSESKSYAVTDNTAPDIGVPHHVPEEPLENQEVTVRAHVSEPLSASGLKNAILWFRAGDQWSSVKMTIQNGSAAAVIPSAAGNVTVEFFIEVFDKAGNGATTPPSSYTAKPINMELSTILTYLAIVSLIAGFLLGTCYFYCFKKTRKRPVDMSAKRKADAAPSAYCFVAL
jgi:hypothetical protein